MDYKKKKEIPNNLLPSENVLKMKKRLGKREIDIPRERQKGKSKWRPCKRSKKNDAPRNFLSSWFIDVKGSHERYTQL